MEFTIEELKAMDTLLAESTAQGVSSMKIIISLSEKIQKEINERNTDTKPNIEITRKK